ncbi:MAG: hypothetical protein ACPG4K_12930 [Haloferula sp.]
MRLITISGLLVLLLMGGLRMLSGQQGGEAASVPLEVGISVPVEILKEGELPAVHEVLVRP